jgi:hypothetical protein
VLPTGSSGVFCLSACCPLIVFPSRLLSNVAKLCGTAGVAANKALHLPTRLRSNISIPLGSLEWKSPWAVPPNRLSMRR